MNLRYVLVSFFVILAVGCSSEKNSPPASNLDAENTVAEISPTETVAETAAAEAAAAAAAGEVLGVSMANYWRQ